MITMPRQRKHESNQNYKDRCKLVYKHNQINSKMNIEEYKKFLNDNLLEYVEFEKEKPNGSKIHMIIPVCQFKVMTKAEINKLFR